MSRKYSLRAPATGWPSPRRHWTAEQKDGLQEEDTSESSDADDMNSGDRLWNLDQASDGDEGDSQSKKKTRVAHISGEMLDSLKKMWRN